MKRVFVAAMFLAAPVCATASVERNSERPPANFTARDFAGKPPTGGRRIADAKLALDSIPERDWTPTQGL